MSNYMIMIISRRHLSNNIWFWRFGYKRAKLALRIRIIKALCEAQFDLNARFKLNINKLEAGTLRLQPVRHILKRMIWNAFGSIDLMCFYCRNCRLAKTSWATATGSKLTLRQMCESTEKTSMMKPGNLWLQTGFSSAISWMIWSRSYISLVLINEPPTN